MTKATKKPSPFPSREEILQFIKESPARVGKREIARAFRLDADQKAKLKAVLRDLQSEGRLWKGRGRRLAEPGSLPAVTLLEITGTDTDGELRAAPVTWEHDSAPPVVFMAPERKGRPPLLIGDRVLARLTRTADKVYEGRTIRRLAGAPPRVLGIFREGEGGARLVPTDRRARSEYIVGPADSLGAETGDLVRAEVLPGRRLGLRHAKVVERLDRMGGPRAVSLIAIHDYGIPVDFSPPALEQAARARAAPGQGREDLRDLPLVTIDGADARDFDDAVWAEPDAENAGGWHLVVAIADVAWYVRPGDPLDQAAYERGNSVYFPDRVVPMLPEALSNGWCSLKPGEDRPCLAAHLWIDGDGHLLRHTFVRGLMRSAARLTYAQVQAARDGTPDEVTGPLMDSAIAPLFGAYQALARGRKQRGVLELDLPERRVILDEAGDVVRVETRARFDSHRLIEEFMITANVAAAEALEKARQPCLYRIHGEPGRDKLEALRQFLQSIGLKLPRAQVLTPRHFNQILAKAAGGPHAYLVSEIVLRSQAQAEYSPDNIGHFGLALRRYCHFTSPIRRYADVLVHRALIRGGKLGEGGLAETPSDFAAMGRHVSMTERRATEAERSAVDRFTAAYLAEHVGAIFSGRINGVTRFGLFVTLDESGADGLVPISTLPGDRYTHDESRHRLRGRHGGREYRLGDRVQVLLAEAEPITGGLIFHLIDESAPRGKRGPAPRGRKKARGRRR